jgi:leucyl aminopeptidase
MILAAKKPRSILKKEDVVILFLAEQGPSERKKALPGEFSYIEKRMDLSFFKGKQSEVIFIPFADNPAIILCGTGKKEDIDAESLRRCVAGAVGLCRDKSIRQVHVIVPDIKNLDGAHILSSIAEGMYLSNYGFDKYKTNKNENGKPLLKSAIFYTNAKNSASILKKVEIISKNTLLCRDIINETSEKCDSQGMAREARTLEKIPGVTCTIYGKKDIEKMKMGLILAVNKGSAKPPQLAVLKYRGDHHGKKFIALVGKGITFDSGGMNLKPSGHIEDMRTDMAGAAAALYAFKSAAELKLSKNLYAVLPLTENMLSNESYRPGDVFTAYNGTTVEIGNTDAEGRLVLADALAFTEKTLKPDCIIDIATLTGSCLATFGEMMAGYVTTDDGLGKILEEAAAATGELIWKLPLIKDYEENVKSDIADICNISSEKNAGTIMGGIFLKNFVKTKRWAHIDIASTARATKPRGYRPKNATGFGVRLLVEAISNWKD